MLEVAQRICTCFCNHLKNRDLEFYLFLCAFRVFYQGDPLWMTSARDENSAICCAKIISYPVYGDFFDHCRVFCL